MAKVPGLDREGMHRLLLEIVHGVPFGKLNVLSIETSYSAMEPFPRMTIEILVPDNLVINWDWVQGKTDEH